MKGLSGIVLLAMLLPCGAQAQKHPLEIHGLHPGMLTREIILHSHGPIDTLIWGSDQDASIFSFKGVFLKDSGEFRVATQGDDITQVTYIARERTVESNMKEFNKALAALKKYYGPPLEDYHNVYRIVTWASADDELKLTTADNGKFYSAAISKRKPRR